MSVKELHKQFKSACIIALDKDRALKLQLMLPLGLGHLWDLHGYPCKPCYVSWIETNSFNVKRIIILHIDTFAEHRMLLINYFKQSQIKHNIYIFWLHCTVLPVCSIILKVYMLY